MTFRARPIQVVEVVAPPVHPVPEHPVVVVADPEMLLGLLDGHRSVLGLQESHPCGMRSVVESRENRRLVEPLDGNHLLLGSHDIPLSSRLFWAWVRNSPKQCIDKIDVFML